jgi:hypothetical protein
MLISGPFDNWWHDAYGLDVKIISPPHSVLALGMWAVVLGALLLVLRGQNNLPPGHATPDRWLFVLAAGVLLTLAAVFLTEYSFPNQQRTRVFYQTAAATYPLYLLALSRPAKVRWSATLIALIYMGILASMIWILPLFPGQPRLGPIYNRVNHFVPLPFPVLLVVPALGIDLFRSWVGHGRGLLRDWIIVIGSAVIFLSLFLVTQWHFSQFMLSSGADNWFFAGDRHWGYTESMGEWRKRFWSETSAGSEPPLSSKSLCISLLLAVISARIGLSFGNWMAKVRR